MVGVEHLVALVPALVQLVLEVAVAELVEVEDAVDADGVVALLGLVELHLLPLLVRRRVPPPRAVHEEVLGQPLDREDLLLVLDVEGVEVAPQVLLLEALSAAGSTSLMPLTTVENSGRPRSHSRKYFMTFLSISFSTSWSSSSSLVRSVRLVRTSRPKYLVPQSTRELGSSSFFSSSTSKAIFMVEKRRLRK